MKKIITVFIVCSMFLLSGCQSSITTNSVSGGGDKQFSKDEKAKADQFMEAEKIYILSFIATCHTCNGDEGVFDNGASQLRRMISIYNNNVQLINALYNEKMRLLLISNENGVITVTTPEKVATISLH